MAHAHHHHDGESVRDYFTEQLLTILVCGLLGFAAIQMYRTDRLDFLAPQFRAPVLYGGIALITLVLIRAVAVWKEAGEVQAQLQCGQDHVHTQDCNHVHIVPHDPDDEHEHSHDMSWMFARMLILVFPVLLFFLGLPNASLSQAAQEKMLGKDAALGGEMLKDLAKGATVVEEKTLDNGAVVKVLKTSTGLRIRETKPLAGGETKLELIAGEGERMRFNDLNDAALDEGKRKYMEGRTAILEGRFKRLADKEFTLFRMKMTCCAADTVPLKVRIVVPQALSGYEDFAWVQVKGQIQFLQVPGQNRYIPVIMAADISDVQKVPPKNEYEQ
jgi:hypothetical protein